MQKTRNLFHGNVCAYLTCRLMSDPNAVDCLTHPARPEHRTLHGRWPTSLFNFGLMLERQRHADNRPVFRLRASMVVAATILVCQQRVRAGVVALLAPISAAWPAKSATRAFFAAISRSPCRLCRPRSVDAYHRRSGITRRPHLRRHRHNVAWQHQAKSGLAGCTQGSAADTVKACSGPAHPSYF